jgi:hypothetical protein
MAVWNAIPVIGDVLEKIFNRVWPDKTRYAEKSLDIELEEVKQSGGRITPRMLFKYMVVGAFALSVCWPLLSSFFPEMPEFPIPLKELVSLAGILFGFGG